MPMRCMGDLLDFASRGGATPRELCAFGVSHMNVRRAKPQSSCADKIAVGDCKCRKGWVSESRTSFPKPVLARQAGHASRLTDEPLFLVRDPLLVTIA